jgi:tetratricopeptide (TPR) repeat protein
MARKRLNRKVALISSAVFVFLVLVAIGVVLYASRDPEKFIKDGDAALLAKDYQSAERNYNKAQSLAKTDSLRIEMLFKLADVYTQTDQWGSVLGCWNAIIKIDPKNVKARYGRLKYVYIMADSGAAQVWQEVASQVSEFIDVAESENLLAEYTAQWEPFGMQQAGPEQEQLGPYLYLLRGRATLEMTRLGGVTDPDKSLAGAIDDLEKVRKLEPVRIEAYLYLAQAARIKGEILASRGNFEQRDKAVEEAEKLLEQAVKVAPDNPRSHINLLSMKLMPAQGRNAVLTQEQIQSLGPEYLSLVEKFPSRAEAFSALAGFYQLSTKNLDKAVEAVDKAVELDRENVAYAISAADLHYRMFSIYGQKPELYKAIELAKNALTLPGAQDKPGPRQMANKWNKILLCDFLANCYIGQVLEPYQVITDTQKQQCLTDAEQVVHEIEQLLGSGEDPQVIKCQGMLELARGNKEAAVKKLYAAYEQLKASGIEDARSSYLQSSYAQLSYALARAFVDTAEVGAVAEFLTSALNTGIARTRPEVILDYVEVLLKLNMWPQVISNINIFEENFGASQRSKNLRIMALIGSKQFYEAEQELARRDPDDPNTIKFNLALLQAKIGQVQMAMAQKQTKESSDVTLKTVPSVGKKSVSSQGADELMASELKGYVDASAGLLKKLLSIEPNLVEDAAVAVICSNYIAEGKIGDARAMVDLFLEYSPDNSTALFYRQMLSEPEPDKISPQRRRQIESQVISDVPDPIQQAVNFGVFYQRYNEPNKAAEEFKKALEEHTRRGTEENARDTRLVHIAADRLFDIALGAKNWELAEQVANTAQLENLDDCDGQFFAARFAAAKEQYKDALTKLNECLKQNPVFSRVYMLRSSVNTALGNEHASIEDVRKAVSLNPLDGDIAGRLALVLVWRNDRLGDNVSSDQIIETRTALERAMALRPNDLQLLSFYAEYVSLTEPLRALAIRQNLQKAVPSIQNAVLLGRLATRMALGEKDEKQKKALFDVAVSAYEQARAIDPQNQAVLNSYAEYYRLTGQEKKAEELLVESQDRILLWLHYFRAGRFKNAEDVLQQLYKTDAKDPNVLRGLLLTAEKTADKEAAEKYSEELLLLEENAENRLIQVQIFLNVGLVKEAEYKLQALKEKYPDEPRALLFEAQLAMQQGHLEKALELTNQNLANNQDSAIAWRLRGQINLFLTNYDEAISDLKKSKSLSPDPVIRYYLARAYLRAGRQEDAVTELKNTIDDPQAPPQAGELLERIYLQLGRKETLRKFYDETLNKFPDSAFWYNRAAAFAVTEGQLDRAGQLYSQAWKKSEMTGKADAASLDGYLNALLLQDKLDKLFEEAGKYVDGDFAPIAFIRMAQAKAKLGDKANAVQYGQQALAKAFAGTNEIFASEILQRAYSLLGSEEVLKYCQQRLEAEPDSLAVNLAMFDLAEINGEYNKALDYIDKCLQIIGSDSPRKIDYIARKAMVLGSAYDKTSDKNYLNRAVEEYESLLAKMPNNTSILNNLAYTLAKGNERLPQALEYAIRAYEISPDNPSLLDTYAYVLFKNDKYSEADKFLQAALQQYEQNKIPVPAEVYEHLGMIKEKLGAKAQALTAYKQALEAGADELSDSARERIVTAVERLSQQE